MGTKFANFHIKTADREKVDEVLQRLSDEAGPKLAPIHTTSERNLSTRIYTSQLNRNYRRSSAICLLFLFTFIKTSAGAVC